MFGFFKKQTKNKDYEQPAASAPVPEQTAAVVMTAGVPQEYNEEIVEIRRRLEQRVHELSDRLAKRDAETNLLLSELGDTKRQLQFQNAGMDRVQAELRAACIETDCARRTLNHMKDEVTKFRQENDELKEKIAKLEADAAESSDEESDKSEDEEPNSGSSSSGSRRAVLEARVAELEAELSTTCHERDVLLAAREAQEGDRMEEIKIIQEALESAVVEKDKVRERFEKDFEALRTVNSDREQQMLDDFEWKLRQVEQAAKKKVEEKAKDAEKRTAEVRAEMERQTVQHQKEMERLRRTEAELATMRDTSHEQQRLLREAARAHEAVEFSKRLLDNEIARLNAQVEKEKNILAAVQSLNQKKMEEREQIFESKLERQKEELTKEVEHRVRSEQQTQYNERLLERLRLAREEHQKEITKIQKTAQGRLEAAQRQVTMAHEQMKQREQQLQKELDSLQSNADCVAMELRRKLDKIDMSYQDQMDALSEKHASELEDWERRTNQAEMQAGQLRATLELVKEQAARELDEKIGNLHHQHRQQLARQYDELNESHSETIAAIQSRHEAEITAFVKARSNGDNEVDPLLHESLNKLRQRELLISDLNATLREQDHALSALTQEKRALQLQLTSCRCQQQQQQPKPRVTEPPPSSIRPPLLERISECSEPSRSESVAEVSSTSDVFESDSTPSSPNQNCNILMPDDEEEEENKNNFYDDNSNKEISPDISIHELDDSIEETKNRRSPFFDEDEEEEFQDTKCESPQKVTLSLPKSPMSTLSLPMESETYLSLSPSRSDVTNCVSIPGTPSPEPSVSKTMTTSNNSYPEEISSSENSNNELQIPRTYFLSHSPDSIFPREKNQFSRSKSLGVPLPKMHLFSRSSSCPLLEFESHLF